MRDEFIIDLWNRIKPLILAKDRLDAADAIIAVCDEYGFMDELEHHHDLDGELMAAIKTLAGEELYDEENEYKDY